MGLFDRFKKPSGPPPPPSRKAPEAAPVVAAAFGIVAALGSEDAMFDEGSGFVCIPVAGESHYQEALQGLRDALDYLECTGHGFVARLVPEPTNPHDTNAIMVTTTPGEKLGYVRADIAKDYQAFLLSLEGPIECSARLTGGTPEKPNIGVVLDFAALKDLKQKIGTA